MSSLRRYTERTEKTEELRIWDNRHLAGIRDRSPAKTDGVVLSGQSRTGSVSNKTDSDSAHVGGDLLLLITIMEMITGKKVELIDIDGAEVPEASLEAIENIRRIASEGWGISFTSMKSYTEQESTQYIAEGSIETGDGTRIHFSIKLVMEREFSMTSTYSFEARGGNLKDPLALNFSGTAVSLTNNRYDFDIDGDGKEEKIPFLKPGSAFLFIDQNGDGKVNNGTELFGTATGDGFSELTRLDSDENGWIDENDSAYKLLGLWSKDANGTDSYQSLKDGNVGALYTGSIDTEFSLKDEANTLSGIIRQSGIYLKENGETGVVQKIDFSI